MHPLRLIGPVLLSTLLACDRPAPKLAADEARATARPPAADPHAKSEVDLPPRAPAHAAEDSVARRSAPRPMPPPPPPEPVAAPSRADLKPAAAAAASRPSRRRALANDAFEGSDWSDSYELPPAHAAGNAKHKSSSSAAAAAANAAPAYRAPPAPPPVPRLDPNARYATTYRPGGGAMAELDAALARGTIPAVYRDLVGDFGARYAAPLAAPAAGAMAVAADTERAVLPPSGGALHLRVALRSAPAPHLPRARLSVTLAMDVSGSMEGPAIYNARAAAAALVRRLDANDRFSLVTFSNGARLVVRAGPIGPRRRQVLDRIDRIGTEGGTNISAGLAVAYDQARRAQAHVDAGADTVRIVMLLSDGQANEGITDRESLAAFSADAFQDGIQTSAFGLGDSFDAPLLGAIADRGAGGYYYLADAAQIAPAFARELDARLVPVALAVEVRVRLRPEVAATKVYGSRVLDDREAADVRAQEVSADAQAARRHGIKRDRQHDAPGGMRFFMPSFARDDRHALLVALQLPPGVGDRPIGSVELRYKDRLLGRNVTKEIPVRVRYGRSDAVSARSIDPSVLRTVQAFTAGDTILAAAGRVDSGDREGASRLLGERAELLQRAARDLTEPRFKEDGLRLARLATAVGGVSDPLALAVLLRGSGKGYLQ